MILIDDPGIFLYCKNYQTSVTRSVNAYVPVFDSIWMPLAAIAGTYDTRLKIALYIWVPGIQNIRNMRIINIEAGVFESMLDRFEAFAKKVDSLCGQGRDKNLQEWLDNQEVCQILNISKRTLQTYRDNGTLPFTRIGNKMYYKAYDLKRVIPLVADREKEKTYKKKER